MRTRGPRGEMLPEPVTRSLRRASGLDLAIRLLLAGLVLLIPFHLWLVEASGGLEWVRYWKETWVIGTVGLSLVSLVLRRRASLSALVGHWTVAGFVSLVILRAFLDVFAGHDLYPVAYASYNLVLWTGLAGVVYGTFRSAREVEGFFRSLIVPFGLVGLLAIIDWRFEFARGMGTLSERGLAYTTYVGSGYRAYLGCDNPMELGIYLAFGTLVSAHFLLTSRSGPRLHRLVAGASWLACVIGLVLTFSRGPLVAGAVGHLLLLVLLTYQGRRDRLVVLGVRVLAAMVVLLTGTIVAAARSPQNAAWLFSVVDWQGDLGNRARLVRWEHAMTRFAENPVFGGGLGTASTRLSGYREDISGQRYFQPESALLAVAVEGGVLLLGALLAAVLAALLALLRRAVRVEPRERGAHALVLAALVALTVEMSINPMLDARSFSVLFWVALGFAWRLQEYEVPSGVHSAPRI